MANFRYESVLGHFRMPTHALSPVGTFEYARFGGSMSRDTLHSRQVRAASSPSGAAATDKDPLTVEVPREFHRRMAAIIDAVQTGIWQAGVHDLLGYATDYAFGQQRGLQTLVLKSKHRSAYVRLHWDTVMGDAVADRQLVDEAIRAAVGELR
jgi:hypothetical protein